MEEKHFETEEQLIKYAKGLEGKSLNGFIREEREKLIEEDYIENIYAGKGGLGQNVERLFFGYKPNSIQGADFHNLKRELKVAPLKKIKVRKTSNEIRDREGLGAKERIVLTIIDYVKLAKETWKDNSMSQKIRLILMFYLHESDTNSLDYIFKLIELWEPSPEDMKIIKNDWEKIQNKVLRGEAQYISEGDTLYLGACTKGATAESSLRKQPYSEIRAKQRAFSLKNSYVNSIINELLERQRKNGEGEKIEKQINLLTSMDKNLEGALNNKFSSYYGKNIMKVAEELEISIKTSKNFYRTVVNKILGGREDSVISEIKKSGIEIKVIRTTLDGKIPEHISFPAFDFIEIAENEWDDSLLKETLETTKYLFVVLKMDCTNSEFKEINEEVKLRHLKLDKILLWNMPMKDIEESARIMWEKTKKVIKDGVEITVVGGKRFNKFPNASESKTMHVRPHAKNNEDTKPLPNGKKFTKQSFWLNKEYIEKVIKKSDDT